jgi:hypothetical protein
VQRYIDNLGLATPWGWGSIAALVVVALIFLVAGSSAAALVCFLAAGALGALALRARSRR